jgi:hypothetical protein
MDPLFRIETDRVTLTWGKAKGKSAVPLAGATSAPQDSSLFGNGGVTYSTKREPGVHPSHLCSPATRLRSLGHAFLRKQTTSSM